MQELAIWLSPCFQIYQSEFHLLRPTWWKENKFTQAVPLTSTHTLWHVQTCLLPCPHPHTFKNVFLKKWIVGLTSPLKNAMFSHCFINVKEKKIQAINQILALSPAKYKFRQLLVVFLFDTKMELL